MAFCCANKEWDLRKDSMAGLIQKSHKDRGFSWACTKKVQPQSRQGLQLDTRIVLYVVC